MAVRRLPVVQEPTGEDAEAAARPGWQWVLVGSGLLVTIWAPLAAVVGMLGRAFPHWGGAASTVLVCASLATAALATGYLVARFGRRASLRHAAGAGLLAAGELWLIGLLGSAFAQLPLAIAALFSLSLVSAAFCALGARLARRKKGRASPG